jgi:GTP-binding protein
VDARVLAKFRRLNVPIVLTVNKLDSPKNLDGQLAPFSKLGIKPIFGISALTGRGIGDLLDAIAAALKKQRRNGTFAEPSPGIAVSIVGKPNVGKSSLLNKIVKQERMVVSKMPGTTRTAIDIQLVIKGDTYTFIDTAGLKRKQLTQAQPDLFAAFQTFKALRRSDLGLFVIDASEKLTKQDQRVASAIFGMEKGVIIVANKIDLFRGNQSKLRDYLSWHFPSLWFAPLYFVSSQTSQGIEAMLAAIKPIYEARHKTVAQKTLDEFLQKILKQHPPRRMRDQKEPKAYALAQIDTNPPLFRLTVNAPAAISKDFRNYLQKSIIKTLNFWGTPVRLQLTEK